MNAITKKNLLIVMHMPSPNTLKLGESLLKGATHPDFANAITAKLLTPFDTKPEHVRKAHGIILGTTENLGYMSGALKDFFDRIYYPVLEEKQGLPCALLIRAGLDGTGTQVAVERIITGLRWNFIQPPLICHGSWTDEFLAQAEELGLTMAAGLEAGLY